MQTRKKVCSSKDSFRSKTKAEAIAKKWGQRVYECPVCFCWHCTSKENWKDEFIDADTAKRQLVALEIRLRTEFNAKKKAMGKMISKLSWENSQLKKQLKRTEI
jgi:hypothetical protein